MGVSVRANCLSAGVQHREEFRGAYARRIARAKQVRVARDQVVGTLGT